MQKSNLSENITRLMAATPVGMTATQGTFGVTITVFYKNETLTTYQPSDHPAPTSIRRGTLQPDWKSGAVTLNRVDRETVKEFAVNLYKIPTKSVKQGNIGKFSRTRTQQIMFEEAPCKRSES